MQCPSKLDKAVTNHPCIRSIKFLLLREKVRTTKTTTMKSCLFTILGPVWSLERNSRAFFEESATRKNPIGDSYFFGFVPRSCHADYFISTFVSPSLKLTIFRSFTTQYESDIADPSSMQDACQI